MSSLPASASTLFNPIDELLKILITSTDPELRVDAVLRLDTLASVGQGEAIRERMGVPILVCSLLEKDWQERANAARLLSVLSIESPHVKEEIRKARAIPILLRCLSSKFEGERVNASGILLILMSEKLGRQEASEAGAIPVLVSSLLSDSASFKESENLMQALFFLSSDLENRAKILASPRIAQLLENCLPWKSSFERSSRTFFEKKYAAGILSNLCSDEESEARTVLCTSEILNGLASLLLKTSDSTAKEYAADALQQLSKEPRNRDVMGGHSLVLSQLLDSLVDPVSPLGRELALLALLNLSSLHPINSQKILETGRVRLFLLPYLGGSGYSLSRRYAARILENIAVYCSTAKAFMVSEVCPRLSAGIKNPEISFDDRVILKEVLQKIESRVGASSDALAFGAGSSGGSAAGAGFVLDKAAEVDGKAESTL